GAREFRERLVIAGPRSLDELELHPSPGLSGISGPLPHDTSHQGHETVPSDIELRQDGCGWPPRPETRAASVGWSGFDDEADQSRRLGQAVLDDDPARRIDGDPAREDDLAVAGPLAAEAAEQRPVTVEDEDAGVVAALRTLGDVQPAVGVERHVRRLLDEDALADRAQQRACLVEQEDLRRRGQAHVDPPV